MSILDPAEAPFTTILLGMSIFWVYAHVLYCTIFSWAPAPALLNILFIDLSCTLLLGSVCCRSCLLGDIAIALLEGRGTPVTIALSIPSLGHIPYCIVVKYTPSPWASLLLLPLTPPVVWAVDMLSWVSCSIVSWVACVTICYLDLSPCLLINEKILNPYTAGWAFETNPIQPVGLF